MNFNLVDFFSEYKLEFLNKKFILAVSTGVDSVVMLDMFIELKKIYNIDMVIAHVNHGVRKESKIEEEYIKKYSKENNIDCYVERLEFDNQQTNFEAVAREKRYSFMFNLYDKLKADYLVLAHHANDNIETIMMRLLRGSSLLGYSGMQEVNVFNGRCIIRPLLNTSKEDILKYQQGRGLIYFEDSTNQSMEYTRNRVRMEILPKLFSESQDLINKFNDFRKTIFEASKIVNSERDLFINKFVYDDGNKKVIDRDEYLKLSEFLKQEVLFEVLKEYKFSKIHVKQFIDIINSDKVNYQNWFKDKMMFVIEYNKIIISSLNILDTSKDEIIIDKEGEYSLINKKIICVKKNVIKNDYNLNELWYNSNTLPICVRTRRNGDKIKVNGITKKVKDLFIDLKIPVSERNRILVTEKDGEILNIFGVTKSDKVKLEKEIDILIKVVED